MIPCKSRVIHFNMSTLEATLVRLNHIQIHSYSTNRYVDAIIFTLILSGLCPMYGIIATSDGLAQQAATPS